MAIPKRKIKPIEAIIRKLPGFKLHKVEQSGGDHLCCHIEDDVGNRFRMWTGSTGSSHKRRYLNFKQDIRQMSNKLKGLLD